MITADLHVHTCYSGDSNTRLEKLIDRCLEVGINCVSICDHNTITGALKLKDTAPFKVIVAEEIMTPDGELMGLFLTKEVPKGLSPQETIERVRGQGGLVGIPHPFGRSPLQKTRKLLSPEILSLIDFVEVFNARTPFSNSTTKSWKLAIDHRLAASAGSDAHTLGEIGHAGVEMPDFTGSSDFLDSLYKGRVWGKRSSLSVHLASTWAKIHHIPC